MKLKINFFKNYRLGFTLVELLVVIAITGILASASYFGINDVRKSIRDNKRRADLNEVARALELFKTDNGQYPTNNYYSISSASPDPAGDINFMPFLKDGGTMEFIMLNGNRENITFNGGYLNEYLKDPINKKALAVSWNNSNMYVYQGANWTNYAALLEDLGIISFPLSCPAQTPGTCGNLLQTQAENWAECCNSGCYNQWCDYDVALGEVTFYYYSLNGWSGLCYGDGSTRSMSVLFTKLEKESKPEERINNVFAFCPTASAPDGTPEHDNFLKLKANFPRAKDCYNGNDDPYDPNGGYACSDAINPTPNWSVWNLNDFNYFVPLTGEFNLR